jgi:hypothetical protein
VLQHLTKRLLESALDGELTGHLGYGRHDPAGRNGGNSRNGANSKTVLTDVGPIQVSLPRDRDGSFEPRVVQWFDPDRDLLYPARIRRRPEGAGSARSASIRPRGGQRTSHHAVEAPSDGTQ